MRNLFFEKRVVLVVFLLTFSIFILVNIYQFYPYYQLYTLDPINQHSLHIITGDEPHYLSLTSVIINHNSLFVEDFFLDDVKDVNLRFSQEYYNQTNWDPLWHSYERSDGHYILKHDPGLSYLLVPGYFLGGIFGSLMTISLIASLNSVVMYKFCSKYVTAKIGFLTTLIFSFTTLFFIYSNQIYPEIVISLLLILSVYFIFEKKNSVLFYSLAGILLGIGVFFKISFIAIDIILIPLVISFVIFKKIKIKNFILFTICFLVITNLALVNNFYTHNSLIGGVFTEMALTSVFEGKGNFLSDMESSFPPTQLIEMFFGTNGIFIFSPIIFMAIIGVEQLWKKNYILLITIASISVSIILLQS